MTHRVGTILCMQYWLSLPACWYGLSLCVWDCTGSYWVLQMVWNLWLSCLWWLSHRPVWSFSPVDTGFSLRRHQPSLLSSGWVRAWRTSLILHRELPGVGFNRRRWNTGCSWHRGGGSLCLTGVQRTKRWKCRVMTAEVHTKWNKIYLKKKVVVVKTPATGRYSLFVWKCFKLGQISLIDYSF